MQAQKCLCTMYLNEMCQANIQWLQVKLHCGMTKVRLLWNNYFHPRGHNAFMKLTCSACSSECQLYMATFQGVVCWVSNNRGWQLIKGGVCMREQPCLFSSMCEERRVDCSCVPSILDTQRVFHLWANWKNSRLEMPMKLINTTCELSPLRILAPHNHVMK